MDRIILGHHESIKARIGRLSRDQQVWFGALCAARILRLFARRDNAAHSAPSTGLAVAALLSTAPDTQTWENRLRSLPAPPAGDGETGHGADLRLAVLYSHLHEFMATAAQEPELAAVAVSEGCLNLIYELVDNLDDWDMNRDDTPDVLNAEIVRQTRDIEALAGGAVPPAMDVSTAPDLFSGMWYDD